MFDNDFFKKFPQQWSSFEDDHGQEKRCQFPTFYEGTRAATGIFTCAFGKAHAALPSKRLMPVPAGVGRSVVVVGAFEYLNPKGMDPYNEILFALPCLHFKKGSLIPDFGLFVKRLIVDVPENVQRGKHVWGMDKSMGEFRFYNHGGMRVCEVHRNGRLAVKLEIPTGGRSRRFEECNTLVTEKGGSVLASRSCMAGRRVDGGGAGKLTPGADPFAVELEALGVRAVPFRTRYIMKADHAMCLPFESEELTRRSA